MATSYTSLLGLALPLTGELSGTWGDTVNNSITSLLDTAVAGTTTLSTDGDVTLTTTTGASNQARQAILLCSGARTALRTITAPAASKIYTVINATTGGFSVKVVGAGPTTGVTIVAGESAVIAWNGSDFIKISNTGGAASFTNVTVSGTTTLSGLTASTALALDGSKNVVSVTNTGTGNNVLSASPTLTGTVGLADLTASGSLTLSAGTANGVAYLNGSKVLTTGSALTFDGTKLGVGTASPLAGSLLTLGDGTSGAVQYLNASATGGSIVGRISGSNTWIVGDTANVLGSGTGLMNYVYGNNPTIWYNNSSEQMRLTSTGLGIGTSSPVAKLQVGTSGSGTGLKDAVYLGQYSTDTDQFRWLWNYAGTGLLGIGTSGTSMIFGRASGNTGAVLTEWMRLDTSGNLGLGVTPQTWGSNYKVIELAGASSGVVSAYVNDLTLGTNFRNDNTNWIYTYTGQYATRYQMAGSSGQHRWYTAPSGTAGNTISFTQAMTLDASGNLLVGTTTANGKMTVVGGNGNGYTYQSTGGVQVYLGDTSGTVGVVGTLTTNALQIITGGSERARIDTSGNLLVGFSSSTSTPTRGAAFAQVSADYWYTAIGHASGVASGSLYANFVYAGSAIGSITQNGTTAVAFNTTSDHRLKTNVTPLAGALAKVQELKPSEFDWIDGRHDDGFIAHELQAVLPNVVTGEKDAVDEGGNPKYQQVDYAKIVPTLCAAIQEQQAIINDLKARLDAANL